MLEEHLKYLADVVRLGAYESAIAKVVNIGDSVVDLGCGSGVLGWLCLRAGAGHVLAIDESDMLEIARHSLAAAEYGECTTFVHGRSSQVDLANRVDVLVCDHVGYFGFDYGILAFMQDARKRFLKPGGKLIPSRICLNASIVGSELCEERINAWRGTSIPPAFNWVQKLVVNSKHGMDFAPADVLAVPVVLGDLDLYVDAPDFFSWRGEVRVDRDGVVHGLGGWFDCELAEGVWMTNSPLAEEHIQRSQAFLPIDEAVPVTAGDTVNITIMARPAEHLIAWGLEFPATGQRFSHSTWEGEFLTQAKLTRANPSHIPSLGSRGRAISIVLGYCDGQKTMLEIEQEVLRNHPNLFPSNAEISRFVSSVLSRETE